MTFEIYDIFLPIALLITIAVWKVSEPKFTLYEQIGCSCEVKAVLRLKTVWLRSSMTYEIANALLLVLSFGCSAVVIVMSTTEPLSPEKVALYTLIAMLCSFAQAAIPLRERAAVYRRAFETINVCVLNYINSYLGADAKPVDEEKRRADFEALLEKVRLGESIISNDHISAS